MNLIGCTSHRAKCAWRSSRNIESRAPAPFWMRRLAAAAACFALTCCGQSQNWSQNPAFITIGGTVSGLTGSLGLSNNGTSDSLSINKTGPFTFALQLASGASYDVAISAQPSGQNCTLTNASGTSTSNVTNIAVTCANVYTIGGTISNLSGTIVLQNNGGNNLTVKGTSPSTSFTFTNPVASDGAYAVTILTQPANETCAVQSGGSGNAKANITSVAISCQGFTLRSLPAIYKTGKAINYSAYRAGGPNVGEIVTNSDITQDLQLLVSAGYNLIRLFGGDANSENVVRIASTTPGLESLKFQAGSFLEGASTTCVDQSGTNAADIAQLIHMANTYSNIVAVSVGNETSLAANLPVQCLVQYIKQVRSAVTQPVTADDDASFYTGLSSSGEKPDTVLPNIDFVAYHAYPFTFELGLWNWQQLGVDTNIGANGAANRATAMMNAALTELQAQYQAVIGYSYKNAAGLMTTTGATLPAVLTETGWKYKPTNTDPIELITNPAIANPVNAKWYNDLLATYTGSNAPVNIFNFEAFNETWKGTDSGWGLWDENRNPLYALCGTTVTGAPTCSSPIYTGAGYDH